MRRRVATLRRKFSINQCLRLLSFTPRRLCGKTSLEKTAKWFFQRMANKALVAENERREHGLKELSLCFRIKAFVQVP